MGMTDRSIIKTLKKQVDMAKDFGMRNITLSVQEAEILIEALKGVEGRMHEILDEICNEYCKYPEIALGERKDVDDANKLLMDKYCATCPIGRL